jgi:Tol biopolymer transport system component
MISTDDEVWELFQRADPARHPDITPITDATTYLERLRSSDATVTRIDDAPSSRGRTWHGWPLARAAAVAAVIAGGLVVVTGDGDGDDRNTRVKVATATVSVASPPMPYFVDLDTGERTALNSVEDAYDFQPSPDGTRMLLYQGDALSIANADGSGVIAIDVQDGPGWRPARWSPDGTRIVYQERLTPTSNVGNLFVHVIATGRRTKVTNLELTTANRWWLAPSFSPDGQNVVFHLARDGSDKPGFDVWSVPVTGGDPELLVEDATWPMYLPDGDLVYVATPPGGDPFGDTLMIAAADGSTRTLTEAVDGIGHIRVSPDGTRVVYGDDEVRVVAVESGEVSMVEGANEAGSLEWVDDHTLLIGPEN